MFAWQCHDFIGHYLSRPVRWKISMSQQQPVVFPAVTICNQNAFRYVALCSGIIKQDTLSVCLSHAWEGCSSRETSDSSSVKSILTAHLLHHPITLQEIRLAKVLCVKCKLQFPLQILNAQWEFCFDHKPHSPGSTANIRHSD